MTPTPTTRDQQRIATRARIIAGAIEVLRKHGAAGLSTLAVQKQCQLSRGAVQHHFATRSALIHAVVSELIAENERVLRAALAERAATGQDPIFTGLRAVLRVAQSESARIERDLWAASRTSRRLHSDLIAAERAAGRDLDRLFAEIFGDLANHEAMPKVQTLTVALIRGLVVSEPLRENDATSVQALRDWTGYVRTLLTPPTRRIPLSDERQQPAHYVPRHR